MNFIKKNGIGILLCLAIAIPSWFLGKIFPVVGGAVIAIIAGLSQCFGMIRKMQKQELNGLQK